MEIDEDVEIESANIPPPEVSLVQGSPEKAALNINCCEMDHHSACSQYFRRDSSSSTAYC